VFIDSFTGRTPQHQPLAVVHDVPPLSSHAFAKRHCAEDEGGEYLVIRFGLWIKYFGG
jgi:hypothetical protein